MQEGEVQAEIGEHAVCVGDRIEAGEKDSEDEQGKQI